jgi:hypothetical protein
MASGGPGSAQPARLSRSSAGNRNLVGIIALSVGFE